MAPPGGTRRETQSLEAALAETVEWFLRPSVHRALHWSGAAHLTTREVVLLRRLAETEVSMGELARSQGLDRSTITVEIARLERAGLAVRRRADHDHRVVTVRLTEVGREVVQGHRRLTEQALAGALAAWSERDRAVLGTVLQRLADELQDVDLASLRPASTEDAT